MVSVPDAVRQQSLEETKTSVLDASLSPKKTVLTVQGKVVKVHIGCLQFIIIFSSANEVVPRV